MTAFNVYTEHPAADRWGRVPVYQDAPEMPGFALRAGAGFMDASLLAASAARDGRKCTTVRRDERGRVRDHFYVRGGGVVVSGVFLYWARVAGAEIEQGRGRVAVIEGAAFIDAVQGRWETGWARRRVEDERARHQPMDCIRVHGGRQVGGYISCPQCGAYRLVSLVAETRKQGERRAGLPRLERRRMFHTCERGGFRRGVGGVVLPGNGPGWVGPSWCDRVPGASCSWTDGDGRGVEPGLVAWMRRTVDAVYGDVWAA